MTFKDSIRPSIASTDLAFRLFESQVGSACDKPFQSHYQPLRKPALSLRLFQPHAFTPRLHTVALETPARSATSFRLILTDPPPRFLFHLWQRVSMHRILGTAL